MHPVAEFSLGDIPDNFQVWVHSCRLLDSIFDFYWT